MTLITPSKLSASLKSISLIRALGYFALNATPCTIPETFKSSTYSPKPKVLSSASILPNPSPIKPLQLTSGTSFFSLIISAAINIPSSILAYPVHLQILPINAFLTSSFEGFKVLLNNPTELITIPGIQKPHCTAPTFVNA